MARDFIFSETTPKSRFRVQTVAHAPDLDEKRREIDTPLRGATCHSGRRTCLKAEPSPYSRGRSKK